MNHFHLENDVVRKTRPWANEGKRKKTKSYFWKCSWNTELICLERQASFSLFVRQNFLNMINTGEDIGKNGAILYRRIVCKTAIIVATVKTYTLRSRYSSSNKICNIIIIIIIIIIKSFTNEDTAYVWLYKY